MSTNSNFIISQCAAGLVSSDQNIELYNSRVEMGDTNMIQKNSENLDSVSSPNIMIW